MSDSKRLAGKVAIVTGAAGGFGKGIAKAFVQQGASVIVVDRLPDAGQATATEIGAAFQAADVTKREDWERLLAKAIEQFGHVHIVVNNAGTTYTTKPTTTVSDHDFDLVFEVNVKSIYLSASVFIPYFLDHERHGSMINISSTSAVRPRPNLVWYGASKAAVSNATKALAIEYAQRQIRFNAVLPVVGITGLKDKFSAGADDPDSALRAVAANSVPMGRPAEPSDIANACVYLASDEASFITGVELPVDGGRCA